MSLLLLWGASELCVDRIHAATVIDVCSKLHVVCDDHRFSDDKFFFKVPQKHQKTVICVLKSQNIISETSKSTGIIPFLQKYKLRYGFLVGAFLFLLITFTASNVLWQIEIKGNSILSEEEILTALDNSGLSLGVYLKDIDTDRIERTAIIKDKRLSWISVNMNGTCAYVEVRERVDADLPQRTLPYANIISTEDALIVDIEAFSGMPAVKIGSYVRKGELLINGIIQKEALGTFPTYATGRITGRIFKSFEIEFPYRYCVLENTGKKSNVFTFNFFGKETVFSPFETAYNNYTANSRTFSVSIGQKTLPFSITVDTINEQKAKTLYRTPEETQAAALRFLTELIEKEYPKADIIEKYISITHTDNLLFLKADITLEKEIGITSEFNIEN